jgi:CheY-like chemotaxis protein
MSIDILFVEDEPRGVAPYFRELERNGFLCSLAESGDQVIRKLRYHKFDAISMDIMFAPGPALGAHVDKTESGLRLLEMIRQRKLKNCPADIPVIVLTAVTNIDVENAIKALGVFAYLKKPIDYADVIDTFMQLKNSTVHASKNG